MILRVILFTVAFHMTFSVVRVTASLDALSHGYGSFTVGLLISLLALFPTFLSMPWGRVVDRVGARLPIAVGGLFLLAGVMIPAVFPTSHFGLTPLAFSCALTGIGMMSTSMVSQQLVGFYSNSHNRTANFAWLATGQAASGLVTPILSGMIIDAFGHRYAFFYGTAAALLGLAAFYWSRSSRPPGNGRVSAIKRQGPLSCSRTQECGTCSSFPPLFPWPGIWKSLCSRCTDMRSGSPRLRLAG